MIFSVVVHSVFEKNHSRTAAWSFRLLFKRSRPNSFSNIGQIEALQVTYCD